MEPLSNFQKVTVVSVFPFAIHEDKPGLVPRYYDIPAAKEDDIEILNIPAAYTLIDLVDRKEKLRIDISPAQVAMAIIRDFSTSQLEYTENAAPGLFAISGEHEDKAKIKSTFAKEIEACRKKQNNWFLRLVKLADDDWTKYHQHRMISDLQRAAAKTLKLEREWLVAVEPPASCPACGSTLPNKNVVICAKCNFVVDKKRYETMQFAK